MHLFSLPMAKEYKTTCNMDNLNGQVLENNTTRILQCFRISGLLGSLVDSFDDSSSNREQQETHFEY